MVYAKMSGLGSYLPKKILTNKDLEKMIDTTDEWIVSRSGIRERRVAAEGETASSMAEIAAREALEQAKVSPDDIDLIIVATCTPDMMFPSTACLLQEKLGIRRAPAFDLSAACSGFIYALSTANQFIANGAAKNVLIVGSEVSSRVLNWEDRSTCVLFSDGAAAMVLSASDEPGIIATELYADGRQKDVLSLPSGINEKEPTKSYAHMEGREVFRLAVGCLTDAVRDILEKANVTVDDVDWIIPHQANLRIINKVADKLNLPPEKVIITLDKHANTSAASIPLALHQGIKDGRIKPGQTVLLEAVGGGLTWGSALLKI